MATINDRPADSRTMKASDFKARCLRLMDEVAESGEEITITKNGRPVAKLAPHYEKPKQWFGRDHGKLRITGDIVSPMPAEWFEDPEDSRRDLP